jgi:hypothetical protein
MSVSSIDQPTLFWGRSKEGRLRLLGSRGKTTAVVPAAARYRVAHTGRWPIAWHATSAFFQALLITEVLSPSSATLNLGDKAAEYLRLPSLAAYLVLSQDEIKAWVYLKGSDQHPGPKVITGANAAISVPALGIDLPLAESYAGVEFENAS